MITGGSRSNPLGVAVHLSVLLAVTALAAPIRAQQNERVLVDGRKLQSVRFEGTPWAAKLQSIEGRGIGNGLFSIDLVAAGDFTLRARLVLSERNATDAAIELGASHFGFDGAGKTLFVDGPLFGGKLATLEDAGHFIQAGKPFDFELRRASGVISAMIDGKKAWQGSSDDSTSLRVGIVPRRGTIVLQRFAIAANFEAPPAPRAPEYIQPAIDAALDKAVEWLLAEQQRDGSWDYLQQGFPGGQTALSLYALLRAGLPLDHPSIARGFAYLDEVVPHETYSAGLMLMAYEATRDPERRDRIKAIVDKLASWEKQGAWGYPNEPLDAFSGWRPLANRPDLSNTQYAVFGLRAARHAGVDVPQKLWLDILAKTMSMQAETVLVDVPVDASKTGVGKLAVAGFRYAPDGGVTSSMTAAGIAILRICKEALGKKMPDKLAPDVARATQTATAWLEYNFNLDEVKGGSGFWKYYQLYGVEKVGTLLDVEKIGEHAWYREGAQWLLKKVEKDGHWCAAELGIDAWTRSWDQPDTCFAMLFLRRATRPTVVVTGEPLSRALAKTADDPSAVRIGASGTTTITGWIDGFSDDAVAKHGGGVIGGLRVAFVEYIADGEIVRRVEGDPSRAWNGDAFTVQHTFLAAGKHRLQARVHLVAPEAPAAAKDATIELLSKEIAVKSDGTFEPWMREAATARGRDLLLGMEIKVVASSQKSSDEAGAKAFDGLQGTRWLCAAIDQAPTLIVEIPKTVRADTIVLSPACNKATMRGELDKVREVQVRINHETTQLKIVLDPDEMKPTAFSLPKVTTIQRLEIRITDRETSAKQKDIAGFAEIALERRKL